ncbi:MAG: PRC-barrel domain-containing protein [Thermoleophilaceae bacterium]|nr:PRC-barrel domain-containing protein [Thermoleophilaceae bacterium]
MDETFDWVGARVDDVYGGRLGKVEAVYADVQDGSAQWLLVNTRRFETRHVLIPVTDAVQGGGHVWVPYERDVVKSAPEITAATPLSRRRELALCEHYRLDARIQALQARSDRGASAAPAGAIPDFAHG